MSTSMFRQALARASLRPETGIAVDFTQPAGEPALAPHDGVAWQVFRNPISLFIGGVTAVLLELAEPRVRSGDLGSHDLPHRSADAHGAHGPRRDGDGLRRAQRRRPDDRGRLAHARARVGIDAGRRRLSRRRPGAARLGPGHRQLRIPGGVLRIRPAALAQRLRPLLRGRRSGGAALRRHRRARPRWPASSNSSQRCGPSWSARRSSSNSSGSCTARRSSPGRCGRSSRC